MQGGSFASGEGSSHKPRRGPDLAKRHGACIKIIFDVSFNNIPIFHRLAHIHILVFEPLVYHLLFFNYFVCQLLRIPTTV